MQLIAETTQDQDREVLDLLVKFIEENDFVEVKHYKISKKLMEMPAYIAARNRNWSKHLKLLEKATKRVNNWPTWKKGI